MTRAEISKIPVGEILGRKAVYRDLWTQRIRKREIVSIAGGRVAVKNSKNVCQNIPLIQVEAVI